MRITTQSSERATDILCAAFAAWVLSNNLYPQAAFLFALALLPNRNGGSA